MMAIKFTFNGKWKCMEGRWTYSGGTKYATYVKKTITFEEITVKMYEKVGIDPFRYKLDVKYFGPTGGIDDTDPVDILDDDTWLAYLCEKTVSRLCVDAKEAVTVEPHRHVSEAMVDLNEAVVDLRDDNLVNCAQTDTSSSRGPGLYANDDVGEGDFGDEDVYSAPHLSDVLFGDVAHVPFSTLLSGGSSQALHDLGNTPDASIIRVIDHGLRQPMNVSANSQTHTPTLPLVNPSRQLGGGHQVVPTRHNSPPTTNCSVPNIGAQQRVGTHNSEGLPIFGSCRREGGDDLGDFGEGLPEVDIIPCPRTSTISSIDENGVYVGRRFKDKKELRYTMDVHAMKNGYEFQMDRSDKKKLKLICKHDTRCDWELVARKPNGEGVKFYMITEYNETHDCGLRNVSNQHAQAKPSVISRLISEDVVKLKGKYKPMNVGVSMEKDYGVSIKYGKAYRSLQGCIKIIGGTPEQSYGKLVEYFHMVKIANPHTLTDVSQDELGRFKHAFMSLGPSIAGFKYCRPVLCVDGAHLKTKYKGTLLVAVGVDAGDHLFPLAIGAYAGEESIESWMYFLEHLKKAIVEREDMRDLVFVSDRNPSIKNCLEKVFPDANHGICYTHLERNVNDTFGLKRYCPVTLHQAAYAYSKREFEIFFDQIKQQDVAVYNYLVLAGVKNWARAHFPETRYAVMTSNYAESLNAALLEARKMTITNMFEFYRKMLQKWYHDRRELALNCRSELAPEVEKDLKTIVDSRKQFRLYPIDMVEYQVDQLDSSNKVNLRAQV